MTTLVAYQGGKVRQAKWIAGVVDSIEHITYVEPFSGPASIFFNKIPSRIEVLNDKDKRFPMIFKALRDEPKEMVKFLKLIEYSRASWDESKDILKEAELPIHKLGAWALYNIFASRSGMTSDTNFRWAQFVERYGCEAVRWRKKIKSMGGYIKRLQGAIILNHDVFKLLKTVDRKGVLLYIDPPYVTTKHHYKCGEFTMEMHEKLFNTLNNLKHAKVVLSHYNIEPYATWYKDWEIQTKPSTKCCTAKPIKCVEAIFIKR